MHVNASETGIRRVVPTVWLNIIDCHVICVQGSDAESSEPA